MINPSGKANILLVDDRAANLLALETVLGELGQNLVRATSSEEAVRSVQREDFAAVVLDLQMAGGSGFEAAKRIRSGERSRDTPVIFLTAVESPAFSVREAYLLGAVDYLVRPLVPEILRAKVAVFVELYRKGERLKAAERTRADAAVRVSEERLKLLVDHAVEYAMLVLDPDGVILEWKAGAERIMGWSEGEAVGRPFALIFPPEDVAGGDWRNELLRATRDGRAEDKRWHLKKDGSRFFANGVLTALRDHDGGLVGFGKVLRDETERKLAEQTLKQSEAWLRTVTDSVPAFLAFVDHDLRYRFVNRACEEWFGLPPAEVLGRHMRELLGEDAYEKRRPSVEAALAGRPVRFDGPTPHVRLGVRETEISYTPHAEGGAVAGFFVLVQDITERKRAEQALREQERRKDEFLAMLAHELRNPLAPIRSAGAILGLKAAVDPALAQVRDIIARQVGHLSRLVDDLLDVARITRGKIALKKEVQDLAEVLGEMTRALAGVAAGRGIDLSLTAPTEPVSVEADPTRLEQMVGNALNNALKFTPAGGKVTVTAAREGRLAVIRVKDTGDGLLPDQLQRVFELFAQTERSLDRSQGGLGIGLTVLRALAELHGGSADLLSDGAGKGAELVIRLPARPPGAAVDRAAPAADRGDGPPRTVLVIDDNVDAADSLAILLSAHGHDVGCVYDPLAALESVRVRPPAVVVCDIGLPKMSGCELVTRLRAEAGLREALCVAVTGYGEDKDRRQALAAGFDHHMTKPVDPAALLRLIAAGKPTPAGPP